MKIIVILLNWNGKKDTLECLASLSAVTTPFQTLIVDNSSADDSVATFRARYPQIPIQETKANLGFAEGNNVGIRWALEKGAEWILLLNNDTTVDPNFLNAFLEASSSAKILGAKILRYHDRSTIDHLGGYWDAQKGEYFSHFMGEPDAPIPSQSVDYVCGAALFFHRSVAEKIGLLEPRYFLFWEESDFCARAKRAGFEIRTAPDARVFHKVSSSFTGGKPQMHYFWWRNRLLWISRNCSPEEKKRLYRSVLLPEIGKLLKRALIKSLFGSKPEEARRYRAGLLGIFDYLRGRFGNAPSFLVKKRVPL